ncbi:MAG: hypothetical protein QNJ36_05455 [Calothrix sp. MO_167.B42]|nr:hypothetical protein [Calothrix sp. MO_167.B42]
MSRACNKKFFGRECGKELEPSTINYQPSTINHQPPTINYQLPTARTELVEVSTIN